MLRPKVLWQGHADCGSFQETEPPKHKAAEALSRAPSGLGEQHSRWPVRVGLQVNGRSELHELEGWSLRCKMDLRPRAFYVHCMTDSFYPECVSLLSQI